MVLPSLMRLWTSLRIIRNGGSVIETILDLHIHSKYSRACSKDLLLPNIATACEERGINIVATGDFTHPAWFAHLKEELFEERAGMYALKNAGSNIRFVIGTEVSSIKKHGGETRRVHHLIFAPNLQIAQKFSAALESRGCNIRADGRPILGITSKDLLSLMLGIDEKMVMIPAHAWTPWFGIFGSKGGYDSLEECFEDLTPHIFAIETGLSSDPLMNRRWSKLDQITLISNSDAHSLQKLGREANVMRFARDEDITYDEIIRNIRVGGSNGFPYTIEFYPEEGKYYLDGHADCRFVCAPKETKRYGGCCPKCKKPLTIGVMNRVEELADRSDEEAKKILSEKIPFRSLVPLPEIIADTFDVGVASKSVVKMYDTLIKKVGNEFFILLHASLEDIARASTAEIARAIDRVRTGQITVKPGYDGIFGVVKVFGEAEDRGGVKQGKLLLE